MIDIPVKVISWLLRPMVLGLQVCLVHRDVLA